LAIFGESRKRDGAQNCQRLSPIQSYLDLTIVEIRPNTVLIQTWADLLIAGVSNP
jgi:hypothetical protein